MQLESDQWKVSRRYVPIPFSTYNIFLYDLLGSGKDLEGDTASDVGGYGKKKVKSLHQPEWPHSESCQPYVSDSTTSFIASLYHALQRCSFHKRICDDRKKGKSKGAIFSPTAFAPLLAQCHIWIGNFSWPNFLSYDQLSWRFVIQWVIFWSYYYKKKITTFYRFRSWLAIFSNKLLLIKGYILLF